MKSGGPAQSYLPGRLYEESKTWIGRSCDPTHGQRLPHSSTRGSGGRQDVPRRLADIAVFRLGLRVRLVRNDTLQSWRAVAKDGFTLPAVQSTVRPSVVSLLPGDTADFEFTPDAPAEVVLEVGAANQPAQGRVLFRVSPAVR